MYSSGYERICLLVLVLLVPGLHVARAITIVTLTCDGVLVVNNQAAAPGDMFACPVATVRFGVEQSDAGINEFLDSISVIYDNSGFPQGNGYSAEFSVDTSPQWIPQPLEPPPAVPTFLRLDGNVQIPDTSATLDIALTGMLGGPALNITPAQLNHTNCAQCSLGISRSGNQFTAFHAIEVLSISSLGRSVYRTNSDAFDGSLPEPNCLALSGSGLLFLIGGRVLARNTTR